MEKKLCRGSGEAGPGLKAPSGSALLPNHAEGRLPWQVRKAGNLWHEEAEEGSQLPQAETTFLHTKAAVATPWDKTQPDPAAIQEQHCSVVQAPASEVLSSGEPPSQAPSSEAPDPPCHSGSNSARQASQRHLQLQPSIGCIPLDQAAGTACNAYSTEDDAAVQDKGAAEGSSAWSGQQQALSGQSHELQHSLTPLASPASADGHVPKELVSSRERVSKSLQVASPLDQAAIPCDPQTGSSEANAQVASPLDQAPPSCEPQADSSEAHAQVLCSNPEKPRQHEQPRETVANCFMCQVSDPASVGATDVLRPDIIDLISDDEEPEVQQKQTYQAEVPQDQSASQLATPGASASEAMPGQLETRPASKADSIAAAPLVSVAPDRSADFQAKPSPPAEQATAACDTDDVDTGPSIQRHQQSACQPADSMHTDSLDDADNPSTVLSLQAEPVDQQQQQHKHQQQQQQQLSLAEQPVATAEPAVTKAKQVSGGSAVQQQQASTNELTEPAAATGDKVDRSAMAGSPADAQSRASLPNGGASAAADAGPNGYGCQIEGVILEDVRGGLAGHGPPQRGRDVLKASLRNSQDSHYRSLIKNKGRNKPHHPSCTARPLKGLFTLLRKLEAINDTEVQHEILLHSLQLRSLSQGSTIQLLHHGVKSAGELMEVLRQHAPKTHADDHLLVMHGPERDIESRQAAMVHNKAIRFPCDEQTRKAWRQGGQAQLTSVTVGVLLSRP